VSSPQRTADPDPESPPHIDRLQRRTLRVLLAAQVLAGAGLVTVGDDDLLAQARAWLNP